MTSSALILLEQPCLPTAHQIELSFLADVFFQHAAGRVPLLSAAHETEPG